VIGARGTMGVDVCRLFTEQAMRCWAQPGRAGRLRPGPGAASDRAVPAGARAAPGRAHRCGPLPARAGRRLPEQHPGYPERGPGLQRYDVELIYVSTLAVFNGHKTEAYVEFDPTDPANIYGRSKYEGEQMVRAPGPAPLRGVRAGWVFGGGRHDKKFVGKILAQAREHSELRAVDDKFGSPTYSVDFARGLARLAESGPVWHLSPGQHRPARQPL